mgnify:CR=1 FL=1|jgi:hypothetical protein
MKDRWIKLYSASLFVLITMILMTIKIKNVCNKKPPVDNSMKGLMVPPAKYSHMKHFLDNGKLGNAKTWKGLRPDNNIPGLLPGPRIGEDLGLKNNPLLSLSTPIVAPLVNKY